jgi:hypothetical protein
VRVKFIADADVNESIVHGLRKREPTIDFLTATAGGTRGLSDPDVLAIAARSGRILLSHDRKTMIGHFWRFVRFARSPGLIIAPQDMPVGEAVEALLLVALASEPEDWQDRVEYLRI